MTKKSILTIITALLSAGSASAAHDIAAMALSPLEYQVPGTTNFRFAIRNIGGGSLGTFVIYWQQDGGAIKSVNKNASQVFWSGTSGVVNDPMFTVTLPAAGTNTLKAWIKSTNPVDNNPSNDTITVNINVFPSLPKKNVVLETFKHQGCCPCYDAASYTDTFVLKNPAYSAVSIYTVTSDVCYNADGASVDNDYGVFAHPMPVFDRFRFPWWETQIGGSFYTGPDGFGLRGYGDREQFYEPAQIYFKSSSYNTTTRELKVTVSAKFFDNMSGDYRFNVLLTEDEVKGYQACAPDVNNYYHKHVLRAMLGGPWGKQGSLPSTLSKNDVKDYEFTYTVPAGYNTDKMHAIALVQVHNSDIYKRRILNSEHKSFKQVVSVPEIAANDIQLRVYPNPAKDRLTIDFANNPSQTCSVILVDISGKVHRSLQCNGDTELSLQSLAPGNYILHVDDGQVVHTQTIVKE